MKNKTEKDNLAMMILRKPAYELNPLIKAGNEKMDELGKLTKMVNQGGERKNKVGYKKIKEKLVS